MEIQGRWLIQGYFEVANPAGGTTLTQLVRKSLAALLGRPASSVRIRSYPVGPAWRHTFWWGGGESPYAEAQFFAHIAEEYPVLSVGVSVEKGLDNGDAVPASWVMERHAWDWQRLMQRAADILENDVRTCAELLARPLVLRLVAYQYVGGKLSTCQRRTFVFHDSSWFERHVGTATIDTILRHLEDLNGHADWWVDTYFACDLTPVEVDGMNPEAFAALLWNFDTIRRRLRSKD